MRALTVVARLVTAAGLIGAIVLILLSASSTTSLNDVDSRYLPTRASLQMHAERLANHIQHRLMEPPLPLLPGPFDTSPDSLPYPQLGPPPYLATNDLPARYAVSWTQKGGWLCDPPEIRHAYLEGSFVRASHRPGWQTPTSTAIVMDSPEQDEPVILAGTWVKTDDQLAFHGAITPVEAYYEYYLPRWFEEYRIPTFGRLLKSDIWQLVEFRYVPHDAERGELVLRESHTPIAVEPDPLTELSSNARELVNTINPDFTVDDTWRESAAWFESNLFPLQDKILVGSPLLMGQGGDASPTHDRWVLALLILALIAAPFSWRSGRTAS